MYDPNNQGPMGFLNYLHGLGYAGERGPDMRAFVQNLRAQGQHPRMDYMRGLIPQGLAALGHEWRQTMDAPTLGYAASFHNAGPTQPRPMAGLEGLANRRPILTVAR